MRRGVIKSQEMVEWEVPSFLAIDDYLIESLPFSLAGCTWFLEMHPKSPTSPGDIRICLHMNGGAWPPKTVRFYIGLRKANGELEEKNPVVIKPGFPCPPMIWSRNDLKSALTSTGSLVVTCRMVRETPTVEELAKVTVDPPTTPNQPEVEPEPEEVNTQPLILVDLEKLSSDFNDLLSVDRKYDVTINVQSREFHAHRTVLAARSSVFRAMYEHDTAEAKSGVVSIPDCDPDTFGDFLGYLYTGKLENVSFQTAYHLYSTAEKYDVQHLKSFCTDYLSQGLTTENFCDVVILADQYNDDRLLSSSQEFFNKNHYKVFLTSEWNALLKNARLSGKLLKDMAATVLKSS